MAGEPVIYMRGFPPDLGVPPGLVEDAKSLIALPIPVIHRLRDALIGAKGFLDREGIASLCKEIVGDPHAEKLARFVPFAHQALGDGDADDLIAQIEDYLKDERKKKLGILTSDEFQQLRERLPEIVRPIPGLKLQAKAERLAESVAAQLIEVQIICDLRPIFDPPRKAIEGMIPFSTLKVTCTGPDGLPVALEAALTPSQLHELADKAEAAKQKLSVMADLLRTKGVAVPVLPLTRPARQNSERTE